MVTMGGLATNYTISTGQTTTADITAKTLTATASASNKVYDGTTTAAATLTFSDLVGSETLGQSVGATFADQNVDTGIVVTVNSITLSDGDNGGLATNYTISTGQTTTADITAKTLTATASASNKVYDGTTTAAATLTFSDLVGSETLGQSVGATFADQNVDTGIVVTVNSITLSDGDNGGLATNYTISTGQTTTADITAKTLTATASASNKVYDGTTTAAATLTFSDLVGSETLGQSVGATFADQNVDTGIVVTVNSITLSDGDNGGLATNYTISTGQTTTADITAKTLTATASASNKVYDGTTTAAATLTFSDLVGSETLGQSVGATFADQNVDTGIVVTVNSITLSDGDNGGLATNYTISTGQTTTADITAKTLTATASASNKVYDGTTTAAATLTFSDLVGSETLGQSVGATFADQNVDTGIVVTVNSITLSDGDNGGLATNYTISTGQTTTADITAKTLTATASASNKVYDGTTTAAATLTFSDLVGSETLGQSVGATFADQNVDTGIVVTVNSITLSDGDNGGLATNYTISTGQTTTADITAKTLTATASASNKVYDGTTTAAATLTFSDLVGSETLGQSVGATFADQNVDTGIVVTVNSITLSDGDNGGLATNYTISTGQTTTADITAKTLTATASASNKVYDGTTTAAATLTFSDLVGSETLGQSVGATFADQNVDTGIVVTVNSITLSDGDNGGLATNYTISTGQTTTADITAKTLTATASASNKVYDGTTTAAATLTFSDLVGSETLGQSVGATFADQNVDTGIVVTVNSITLSDGDNGGLATNYTISTGQTTTADITAKTLTATASASNKVYDGTTTAAATLTFSDLVGSETLGQSVGATFADQNVDTGIVVTVNSITLSDGDNGGLATNYTISTGQTTTADITAKTLTATASASNKVYDGTTTAAATLTFSDLVGSETLGQSVGATFADQNVDTGIVVTVNSITLSDGDNGGLATNYTISTGQTTTADITAKTLTATASASNKVYDGTTTAAATLTFSDLVGSETLGQSVGATFADQNVDTGIVVTVNSITLSDGDNGGLATNYTISTGQTTTADITAKTLTATASASNKVYDGTTTAAATLTFSDLVGSETLGQSVGATFADQNVDTGIVVTVNSITLSDGDNGGLATNYTISTGQTTTADITAKTLTATASASNKVYDGTTTAAATLTFSDLVGSETLGQSVGATFADQNVDTGIVVTVNSITLSDGDNGGLATNYTISTGQTTTADITAKTLTATASASNKVYDGTTTAAATLTFSDLVGSETLGQSVGATFADQNVDTGIVVTVNSITLSDGDNGGLATNYTISTGQTTTADITAKTLTATASASNKVYDGTTTAAATLTFSDLVGSETLGQSVGATFADQNVDTGIVVTVNSITLSDGDNGGLATNYTISTGQTTTADITAKTLTATASASNKVYDGTTTAAATLTFSDLVGSETLGQSVGATFADQNVDTGIVVTVNSITLSDGDNGGLATNYTISTGQTTTADITAKTLTATASASNKVYDGTTTAAATLTFSDLVGSETLGQSVGATFADQNVDTGIVVTVNSITLSDGDNGGLATNYTISTGQTTTADITAKTLTATASASNKVYDGTTTAAATLTFSDLVGSETLGQSVGATFADQNVDTGIVVTVNSITLSDGDNGGLATNYTISTGQTTTADITAKTLTATASASNKVYDGTTTAAATLTFSDLVGSETLGQSVGATFADQNVDTGIVVTVNSITLSDGDNGGLATNYTISTGQTTTADITAKTLTATASASNKVYDGTTTAAATLTFSDLVGSETLGQSVGATFADQNVDTGIVVTVNSITLSDGDNGGLATNYTISTGQTTTADITAKTLTATASASNKVYDGTTTAAATLTFSDLVGSETLGQSVGATFADQNVDTGIVVTVNSITLSDGDNGGLATNYTISTGQTTTADITAKTLTATASASNKVYDGTTTAAATLTFSDLVGSETLGQSVGATFADQNVDTGIVVTVNSITLSDGDNGGLATNYTISTGQTTTADITAKTLTATASASNKVYDGTTTAAATLTFSDLVGSETLGQSVGATFADQNVDTGIVVTVNSITLSDGDNGGLATNYTISTGQTTTADITAKTLTATASASNKVYDGTTTAAATLTFSDLVGSETLGQSVGATFADQNVDTGIVVTVNSITLSDGDNGGLATNYTISTGQTTTADITAKTLTATASASNKVYDGTTTAAATLTFSDLVGSETLGQSVGATFADQNVDTGIVVTVNSITLSDGDNGGLATNYTISTGQTTTADITAKTLTATASASNKVYDGTTTAAATLTFSDLVGSETLGQSVGATFADQNVDTGIVVTVNSITLSDGDNGGLATNYTISTGQTTTADITAKTLTATASASNKVYDGTTTAAATLTFSDLVGSETLGQSVGATFADQNVDTGIVVTVNSITLSDGDNGGLATNYTISTGQTTTADITAKTLTATASASNKVYDGTTTAAATLTFSDLVGSETLGQSVGATFADQNVDTGIVVTVNSITLSDGDNGGLATNYTISTGQTTTADITAKTLTATASASNKVYDGTTTAAATLTFSDLVGSETLGQSVGATFADQNVDTGIVVTVNSITLSDGDNGGLATNYTISTGQTTTADITAKTLTATASASNKVYDGTTTAAATLTFSDLVGSETLGQSVGATFADQNVDTGIVVTVNSITLSDGDNGGLATNYTISTGQTTTADITAKTLTATASASNKVYDGTTTAAATLTFSDLVGSETLGQSVGATFADQNVDTGIVVTVNSITLSDGDNGGLATNYTISTGQTTTADITAKTLTATASASNKVYDGTTTAAATLTFSDLVGSETLGQSVGATFADQNVDTGIVVTVNSITLSDGDNGGLATNYTISTGQATTANITSKTVVINSALTSATKVYDGTTTAEVTRSELIGLIDGEDVTASGGGNYDNANVGTDKAITISYTLIDGENAGLASNYTIAEQTTNNGVITAKPLTYTITGADKTYDGTVTATATLILSGFVGDETINVSSNTSTFDNKNAGSDKTITVNNIVLANGENGGLASNYSISVGQTTTANITPKTLTISGIASN